jgi:tetratricopeptide (TPR) repeat protein
MNRVVQNVGFFFLTVMAVRPMIAAGQNGQAAISPQVVEHFQAGEQELRSGRPNEAIAQFRTVLELAPSLSEARINLGLAYHLAGEYKLAVVELQKGLAQSPNVLGANLILGVDELRLGSPAKAVPPLERVTRIDASNQQAQSSLADAYLDLGQYQAAARSYNAAFGTRPTAENLLHLGHAYLQMSSQLTAAMAHDQAATAWAKRLAGDLLSERQLWSDAARRYQFALARDPTQPGLHGSLASALLEQGKTPEAEEEFQSELKIHRESPRALAGLAEVELQQGDAQRALVYASELARTAPEFAFNSIGVLAAKVRPGVAEKLANQILNAQSEPGAPLLAAALYSSAGNGPRARHERSLAEIELKQLTETQQVSAAACSSHHFNACIRFLKSRQHLSRTQLMTLGESEFALNRYPAAADAFAAVWARSAQDPETLYWLIQSYSKIADACFSELANRYPKSPQAYELEAETYRARGDDSKAIQQYQRAAVMQPSNPAVHEALGKLYLNRHQLPDAQKELEEALKLDPTRAQALYLMGRLEIGLAKPKAAIPYIERALHYDPHLLEAHASLGLAYLRAGSPALAVTQLEQSASLDYYGDLHYMLYQAYRDLGKTELAENALAVSQALRRKTAARDQALIRSAETQ